MKVEDLHIAFKINLDKNAQSISFGGCPAFLPEEIDLFLNQAYIEIINNKFTGTNARQEAFEGSVKRILDLEGLVKTDLAVAVVVDNNSNVLSISDFSNISVSKRMFFINGILNFDSNKKSNISLIDHELSKKFLKTYNNDPWIDTPVATIENNTLKVFIDKYKMVAPYTLDITYVKRPTVIVNTDTVTDITEVPEYVLYEVVNRAVVLALDDIESKRTTDKLQLNNLQE